MEPEILEKLESQQRLLEQIFSSTEKTRKMFLTTLIISLAVIVLPLIGIALMLPGIVGQYSGLMQ